MILVTGAEGTVGSYLDMEKFSQTLIKTDIKELNILDLNLLDEYFKKNYKTISVILHLAALTDVGLCEIEKEKAYLINTIGTQNIALMCAKYDITLCYLSTLEVFGGDGSTGPFNEYSDICVANEYARTKFAGENIIRDLLKKFYIVRTAWVMGGGVEKDKKFTGKIIQQIKTGNKKIYAINNCIGSPTYARELVRNISLLIDSNCYGIYHITNNGFCSRYEMAKEIIDRLGADVEVVSVNSDYFNLPKNRITSECSVNFNLNLRKMNLMSDWKTAIKNYLDEVKKNKCI